MKNIHSQYHQIFNIWRQNAQDLKIIDDQETLFYQELKKFQNDLAKHKTLLNNYTGIQKHIAFFLESYRFGNKLDYSTIIKLLPQIKKTDKHIKQLKNQTSTLKPFKNRYNKEQLVTEAEQAIIDCRAKMTLQNLKHKANVIAKHLQKTNETLKKYNDEQQQLKTLRAHLQSNTGIWKEKFDIVDNALQRLIPIVAIKKYEPQNYRLSISNFEKDKASEITNYEKKLGSATILYQSKIDEFKTNRYYQKDFLALQIEIIRLEKIRKTKEKYALWILIAKIVIGVILFGVFLWLYFN